MARLTKAQREVLELMVEFGTDIEMTGMGGRTMGRPYIARSTVHALVRHGWIELIQRGQYRITEAGRRAVARSDGGV